MASVNYYVHRQFPKSGPEQKESRLVRLDNPDDPIAHNQAYLLSHSPNTIQASYTYEPGGPGRPDFIGYTAFIGNQRFTIEGEDYSSVEQMIAQAQSILNLRPPINVIIS